jgi:integrase/recombinase XerD
MNAHALVDSFLDAIAAERGAAKNTIESYRRDLDFYVEFLGRRGKTPREAADTDIRALSADGAERGLSPASVARRLSAIRQFHKHLFVEGLRGDDPALTLEGRAGAGRCRRCSASPRSRDSSTSRAKGSTIRAARRANGSRRRAWRV